MGWLLVRNPDGRTRERDDTYSVAYGPAVQQLAHAFWRNEPSCSRGEDCECKSLGES